MNTQELKVQPANNWLEGSRPFMMAGPCSAESYEQVMETARFLAATGKVSAFRAGVWKPRTRPGTFEGPGAEAFDWLREVQRETGLKTAVEVANAGHVQKALKAGVDILWIGARTTVNPFYVQEIADALKGIDIPVLVKNPLHPDTDLWVGAIERIAAAGISKIAAVHRGWFTPVPRPYRNDPRWEMAIDLRLQCPGVPIFTDPSHISGRDYLVPQVAQDALDLAMDGLMIEVHPDPLHARSDAAQQLSFSGFTELLHTLIVRSPGSGREFLNRLETLRDKIDDTDAQLIMLLARRMELVKEIGAYKKENNVSVLQLERWREIVRTRLEQAERRELDRDYIYSLLQIIHKYSLDLQTAILSTEEARDEG